MLVLKRNYKCFSARILTTFLWFSWRIIFFTYFGCTYFHHAPLPNLYVLPLHPFLASCAGNLVKTMVYKLLSTLYVANLCQPGLNRASCYAKQAFLSTFGSIIGEGPFPALAGANGIYSTSCPPWGKTTVTVRYVCLHLFSPAWPSKGTETIMPGLA